MIYNKKEWGKILLKQVISCLKNTPYFENALQIVKKLLMTILKNFQPFLGILIHSKFFNKYNKSKFLKSDGIANNLSGYKVLEILIISKLILILVH